ncbi:hypothetical protein KSP40_PGU015994 [Platanthera guangdongensis]|uniref:Secreted protein n=1 Tax=Platanthera guangdongensis TaxID=2320717 RepID=A0ABR2LFE3_9ASPA
MARQAQLGFSSVPISTATWGACITWLPRSNRSPSRAATAPSTACTNPISSSFRNFPTSKTGLSYGRYLFPSLFCFFLFLLETYKRRDPGGCV